VVVGVCKVSLPFTTMPIVYTRFSQAAQFTPQRLNGRMMTFVLAKPEPDVPAEEVCKCIRERTGLQALTRDQFFWKTINYFLSSTGIPINFGITVALGFVVGVAIAGQTFYLFTIENLKQFGALKAMGVGNLRIVGMILTQAVVVGAIGYALGIGLAATFFESTSRITHLAGLGIPWQVLLGAAFAVLVIVVVASLMSIRRVLVLEPAEVFR
jgi:putative ABC transport system permease protein